MSTTLGGGVRYNDPALPGGHIELGTLKAPGLLKNVFEGSCIKHEGCRLQLRLAGRRSSVFQTQNNRMETEWAVLHWFAVGYEQGLDAAEHRQEATRLRKHLEERWGVAPSKETILGDSSDGLSADEEEEKEEKVEKEEEEKDEEKKEEEGEENLQEN